MLHIVLPSPRMPAPSAPQALSAPPANTLVPGARPARSAISGRSPPVWPNDSVSGGQSDSGRLNACAISALQSLAAASSSRVPAASEYSVAYSPVSRKRT
ncbi:hypothetical protein D3C71_1364870 [compost metagenome]